MFFLTVSRNILNTERFLWHNSLILRRIFFVKLSISVAASLSNAKNSSRELEWWAFDYLKHFRYAVDGPAQFSIGRCEKGKENANSMRVVHDLISGDIMPCKLRWQHEELVSSFRPQTGKTARGLMRRYILSNGLSFKLTYSRSKKIPNSPKFSDLSLLNVLISVWIYKVGPVHKHYTGDRCEVYRSQYEYLIVSNWEQYPVVVLVRNLEVFRTHHEV